MWLPQFFRPDPTRPPVRLTADGWQVFDAAVRVARRNRHEYVSTEHLLIGIVEAGSTPAGVALEQAGIAARAILQQWNSALGLGQVDGPLPLTPRAKMVFEAAQREVEKTGAAVSSLGLLLALARETDGIARELMARAVAAAAEPGPEPDGGA